MNEFSDISGQSQPGSGEQGGSSSNIFLNMAQTDSTGIPSLKQAPSSMISSSAPESKVSNQAILVACVLAIGGGAIYGMRYIGMQAGLDKDIASIDYASDSNTVDFSRRFETVMQTLDESNTSVRLAQGVVLPASPFTMKSDQVEEEPVDPSMSQEERDAIEQAREREREIERRREMVIGEAMRFELQGIIGGSRPAARVSGQPVRVGMGLGEYFTVIEITGRSVVIEGDSMRFELAIGHETIQLD